MIPRLPQGWDQMALRSIKAFGKDFDIEVTKADELTHVKVIDNKQGTTVFEKTTPLKKPLNFQFKD